MGKNKHSKVMGFSNILGEAEIHTIPKTYEKWISIIFRVKQKSIQFPKYGKSEFTNYWKSIGKHRDFPYIFLPRRFRVDENPCNSQCLGMYKFP